MKIRKIILLFVLMLGAIGVGLWLARRPASDPVKVTLQLKWLKNAGFVGDLVAYRQGLWKKHHLDVTITPGGVGIDPIKAVTSGRSDFGVANGDQLLLAANEGAPVVALALVYAENPLSWIVRKDSKIERVGSFRGKRIGLTYIDDEPIFQAMLNKAGVKKEELTIVPVKFDLGVFYREEVDAYPVFRNTQGVAISLQLAQKNIETAFVGPDAEGVVCYSNVYFTTRETINSRPKVVDAFLRGVIEGWQFARDNPDSAAALIQPDVEDEGKDLPIVQRSVRETIRLVFPTNGAPFGDMTSDGWKSTLGVLENAKLVKKQVDLPSVFTMDFLQKARVK